MFCGTGFTLLVAPMKSCRRENAARPASSLPSASMAGWMAGWALYQGAPHVHAAPHARQHLRAHIGLAIRSCTRCDTPFGGLKRGRSNCGTGGDLAQRGVLEVVEIRSAGRPRQGEACDWAALPLLRVEGFQGTLGALAALAASAAALPVAISSALLARAGAPIDSAASGAPPASGPPLTELARPMTRLRRGVRHRGLCRALRR